MTSTVCPTPEKIAHDDHGEAQRHAARLRRQKGAPFVQAYRCRCGSWHVGRSLRQITRMLGPRRALPGQRRRK